MKKLLIALFLLVALLVLAPLGYFMLRPSLIIPKETAKAELSSPHSHFLNWRGAELHYTDEGSGFPVLMIHGFGGSYTNFSKLAELMKNDYRVIRIDLPGFGLSDFPEVKENHDFLQEYRDYLSFILDTLHLDSVYVIGNSMGGAMAWACAADHPDKVQKIVLLDAAGYDTEKAAAKLLMFKFKSVGKIFEKGMPLFMSWQGLQKAYFRDDELLEENVVRNNKFTNREGNLQHMLNLAKAAQFPDTAWIQQVQCPALIVWGVEDEIIPVEHAQRFKRDIKNSEVVLFDRCGHCPMMEEAEKTKEAAVHFFTTR
ncbi:MAG: alpha/beta hydrolase [Chitinophagales bacterium]|nr:alpha/beta hydrolase [Chitinophagales bacterium]